MQGLSATNTSPQYPDPASIPHMEIPMLPDEDVPASILPIEEETVQDLFDTQRVERSQDIRALTSFIQQFLELFPQAAFAAQSDAFKKEYSKEDRLIAECRSIHNFIETQPACLSQLLDRFASNGMTRKEVQTLLVAGAELTPRAVNFALKDESPSYFDLFIEYGYQLSESDVRAALSEFAYISLRNYALFFTVLERLQKSGFKFTEDYIAYLLYTQFDIALFGRPESHLRRIIEVIRPGNLTSLLFEKIVNLANDKEGAILCCYAVRALIQCGYSPTGKDFQSILELKSTAQVTQILSVFFEKGYKVTSEDFAAAVHCSPFIIRQLTSSQKEEAAPIGGASHNGGYVITEKDLIHFMEKTASLKVLQEILKNGHCANPSVFPEPPKTNDHRVFVFHLPLHDVIINYGFDKDKSVAYSFIERESPIEKPSYSALNDTTT